MKIFLTILFIIVITGQMNVYSQQTETLLNNNTVHGGYGAPSVSFSNIAGELAFFVGGRGGWIFNFNQSHSLSVGGAGYGLTNNVQTEIGGEEDRDYLFLGYGGLEVGYTNKSYRLIHFTVRNLIGSGTTGYRSHHYRWSNITEGAFFVTEPGINVEINITEYIRLNAGLSYRLVSGSDHPEFTDGDFNGISGVLTMKFGWF